MKYILIILLSIPILCFTQEVTYSEVKAIDSMNKSAIYEKVKLWAVSLFEKTQGVIQVDDKESGLLAFDARTTAISPKAPAIDKNKKNDVYKLLPFYHEYYFKFKVQIKDQRYKVDISDIKAIVVGDSYVLTSHEKAPFKYSFSKQSKADSDWKDIQITFDAFSKEFIASLHNAVSKKEDW